MDRPIIFTKRRDPRLVTVRRGGTLKDADHRLLAVWAAENHTVYPERKPIEIGKKDKKNEISSSSA
jgi:hypothetical protein